MDAQLLQSPPLLGNPCPLSRLCVRRDIGEVVCELARVPGVIACTYIKSQVTYDYGRLLT
jgi:hypothetical protein